MPIKDRIVRLDRVPASQLLPNPKNWRTHPDTQADALRGSLAEVGFANAVLARETPDGLQLIDGHLKPETTGDGMIPVLTFDVSQEEADKTLGSHDPLAAMATADSAKLGDLLATLETNSPAVEDLLKNLAEQNAIEAPDFDPVSAEDQIITLRKFPGQSRTARDRAAFGTRGQTGGLGLTTLAKADRVFLPGLN